MERVGATRPHNHMSDLIEICQRVDELIKERDDLVEVILDMQDTITAFKQRIEAINNALQTLTHRDA